MYHFSSAADSDESWEPPDDSNTAYRSEELDDFVDDSSNGHICNSDQSESPLSLISAQSTDGTDRQGFSSLKVSVLSEKRVQTSQTSATDDRSKKRKQGMHGNQVIALLLSTS